MTDQRKWDYEGRVIENMAAADRTIADLRAAVAAANQRAEQAEAERDALRHAARNVISEWGTEEWIRPTFEGTIDALRALVADQPEESDG